ncbi:MAG: cytochrome c3 family protein [Candidatus Coatesbacteria bacterium]|nr:MAG: cytochrome c3 family protein [Candidatus Coatesbacteria bacterium]
MKRATYLGCGLALAAWAGGAAAAPPDACVTCHDGWPETKEWRESAHAAADVGCVDCHGGDPAAASMAEARRVPGFVGEVPRRAVPALCARCHSDPAQMKQYGLAFNQLEEYGTSVHGRRLAEGDENVATCADCHGAHLVLAAEDTRSSVNKRNVPATCDRCHGDEAAMAPYGLSADTFEEYAASVHGRMLLEEQVTGVPSCADCHGNHGAAPPGVEEVVNVCGSCHVNQRQYYKESPHAPVGEVREACVLCHGNHLIASPTDELYTGTQTGACGSCHEPESEAGRLGRRIAESFVGAKSAIEEARGLVEEAHAVAISVGPWEQRLDEAEGKITEAYPVAHSLSLESVNDLNREAVAGARDVINEVNSTFRDREHRQEILIYVLALVVLIILLLGIKWRRLFKGLP